MDEFCVASVPLLHVTDTPMDDLSQQKMIVCHDMMGGYVNDKYTQGTG